MESALILGVDVACGIAVTAKGYHFSLGAISCLISLVVAHVFNSAHRQPRLSLNALADMRHILISASGPMMLVAVANALGQSTPVTLEYSLVLVAAVVIGRIASYAALRLFRRRGWAQPTVVVGSGPVTERLIAALAEHRSYGLAVVGVDDTVGLTNDLGRISALAATTGATRLIVADAASSVSESSLLTALRSLSHLQIEILIVPRLAEFGASAGDRREQPCQGVPLVWLPRREWRREQLLVKRALDIALSLVVLVLTLPLQLVAAAAIRLTSPGPVLFRQVRVGKGGRPFEMLKLRSMRVDATATIRQGGGGDPRITPIGRIIRRLSIDELPQLWNVLRGDMSMVGPRPELPPFVEACSAAIPGYADRHRLHVGLTGLAQVNGCRGAGSSLVERAIFDNYYIDHWSMWGDLSIIARTAISAVRGS